jgi:hypothetical protein
MTEFAGAIKTIARARPTGKGTTEVCELDVALALPPRGQRPNRAAYWHVTLDPD